MRTALSDCLFAAGRTAVVVVAISAAIFKPSPDVRGAETRAADFQTIGLEEFRRIQAAREDVIVDARPEDEYSAGHVPGAVNLPRYKVVVSPAEVEGKWSKGQTLVLYCGSAECQDAALEARSLSRLGYTHVSIFGGGMKEWRDHKLPEERFVPPVKSAS